MAMLLLLVSIVPANATTYYISPDGIKYRDISATTIAFSGVTKQTESLTIPNEINGRTITMIDSYAFRNDGTLKTLDLSVATGITSISTGAFLGCTSLESIVIPSNVLYTYEDLFRGCTSLQSAEVYAPITSINEYMFGNCSALKEFTVPATATRIDKFAFENCASLETVTIPESVTRIAVTAFRNCPNLTLKVYEDSYAHAFAVENEIPYVLIQTYEPGDVDRDGALSITDVTLIQKYLAELATLDDEQLLLADYLSDGDVNIADATAIQIAIAE